VDAQPYKQRFIDSMDDDFNTAQALAALFDLAREINRADEAGTSSTKARQTLSELADILGLTLRQRYSVDVKAAISLSPQEAKQWHFPADEPISLEELISRRNQFREDGKWQLADEIRAKLAELGITLEDTAKGTVGKRKR